MGTSKQKHKAIIFVGSCEVHPMLETGECSGRPVLTYELQEYGIEFPFLIEVEGFDKHDCLTKLKNKLTGLKNDG